MFKFLVLEKSIAPVQAPAAQNFPNFVEQLGEQVQLLPFTPPRPLWSAGTSCLCLQERQTQPWISWQGMDKPFNVPCHSLPAALRLPLLTCHTCRAKFRNRKGAAHGCIYPGKHREEHPWLLHRAQHLSQRLLCVLQAPVQFPRHCEPDTRPSEVLASRCCC